MDEDPAILAIKAAANRDAFAELYERYFKRVYNYIRCRCGDPDTADDLTAQVFERLLYHIEQYRPERGPFEAWLFAVIRNVVNGHYRKQRSFWLVWENLRRRLAAEASPEERMIQQECSDQLLAALARLDERSRDLLSLKYAAGLNSREISRITRLSEGNVRVIVYRALGQLRAELAAVDRARLDRYSGEGLHEGFRNERAKMG